MADAGYKQLISYKLAQIAFDLGWDLLDWQINAVEEKHQKEGGYSENLLRKRLEYEAPRANARGIFKFFVGAEIRRSIIPLRQGYGGYP